MRVQFDCFGYSSPVVRKEGLTSNEAACKQAPSRTRRKPLLPFFALAWYDLDGWRLISPDTTYWYVLLQC